MFTVCHTVLVEISRVCFLTEGGSTNPNVNSDLARAMETGKARNVPNATMMEFLRKLVSA